MAVIALLLLLVALIRLFGGKQAGKEAFGVVKTFFIIVLILIVCIIAYFVVGYLTTGVNG